jgi:small subunit ribosomal protein S20
MPNIKSQKKRMRQTEKRTLRNRAEKTRIKTYISYFQEALEKRDAKKAEELLSLVAKYIDKAVSKGIIHKNRAADKKSRLAKKLALLKKEVSEEEKAKEAQEAKEKAKEVKEAKKEKKTRKRKTKEEKKAAPKKKAASKKKETKKKS